MNVQESYSHALKQRTLPCEESVVVAAAEDPQVLVRVVWPSGQTESVLAEISLSFGVSAFFILGVLAETASYGQRFDAKMDYFGFKICCWNEFFRFRLFKRALFRFLQKNCFGWPLDRPVGGESDGGVENLYSAGSHVPGQGICTGMSNSPGARFCKAEMVCARADSARL